MKLEEIDTLLTYDTEVFFFNSYAITNLTMHQLQPNYENVAAAYIFRDNLFSQPVKPSLQALWQSLWRSFVAILVPGCPSSSFRCSQSCGKTV